MKAEILKIAGVKSEKEFYKKYPTEAAFQKAHGKAFKKAKLGATMQDKGQLTKLAQLTSFDNPPQAKVGDFIGGDRVGNHPSVNFRNLYQDFDYGITGNTGTATTAANQQVAGTAAATGDGGGGGLKAITNLLSKGKDSGAGGSAAGTGAASAIGGASDGGGFDISKMLEMFKKEQGGNIRKAQTGYSQIAQNSMPAIPNTSDPYMWGSPPIGAQQAAPAAPANPYANPPMMQGFQTGADPTSNPVTGSSSPVVPIAPINPMASTGPDVEKTKVTGFDKIMKKYGGGAGKIYGGFKALAEEKKQRKIAQQTERVAGLAETASRTREEEKKRRYNEPDLVQGMNPGGVGTNPLAARDGMRIGGNPTEIQNMYNPGDIYQDQGFEPLSDSEIVKQYRAGGLMRMQTGTGAGGATPWGAIGKVGSDIGGMATGNNAGGQIGGEIGGTIGLAFGPAGQAIGQVVGTIGGGLLDTNVKRMEKAQKQTKQHIKNMAFESGAQQIQAQHSTYVKNGGWVSNDWQPQVITQFGEHSMKDLLKRSPEMDTLRTGGHIKQNELSPLDKYAFGGELKTTWGGHAEPISQNPYLPGTGETVMFRGKSHEEGDGNGHTGIGVTYGNKSQDSYTDYAEFGSQDADADVEVERGEPATELEDSETGEKNMVVYGNLKIPNMFLHEIGDPSAKGKKFKNYANDLSKQEAKQNKIIEDTTEKINNLSDFTQFGKNKLDTLNMIQLGAKMKLKDFAAKKIRAADLQHALNKTAEEHGLEADSMVDNLIKGKIVKAKDTGDMAKFGAELSQAGKGKKKKKSSAPAGPLIDYQRGNTSDAAPQMGPEDIAQSQYVIPEVKEINPFGQVGSKDLDEERYNTKPDSQSKLDMSLYQFHKKALAKNPLDKQALSYTKWFKEKYPSYQDEPSRGEQITDALTSLTNQVLPYLRPSDQEELDPNQLMGEMYAMGNNQQEPVPAQFYHPDLGQTSDISLQDQLNANQADFNAMQRQTGYNPAAQSALAAQKYAANSSVLGKQFQMNQSERQTMNDANRTLQNQAQLQNLQIADTQYGRQSMAKSKTKEQTQAALNSISDKMAKHKLENRQLGIYENMYNYRYDSKGRLINMNPLQQFDVSMGRGSLPSASKDNLAPGYEDTYNASGQRIGTRKKGKDDTETSRNGRIVRAIKNL